MNAIPTIKLVLPSSPQKFLIKSRLPNHVFFAPPVNIKQLLSIKIRGSPFSSLLENLFSVQNAKTLIAQNALKPTAVFTNPKFKPTKESS